MFENWKNALEYLEEAASRHLELQVQIAEIPATYYNEKERAAFMAQQFKALDLQVSYDAEGNVLAYRSGAEGSSSLIIVAAHLDAAFPEGTSFKVSRKDGKLFGPSIVDNSLGLMAMIALGEALNHADIKMKHGLLFVATVGEEGLGDLRGVKALMEDEGLRSNTRGFIALDSQGHENIVYKAMGSKRFRVDIRGRGGHSFLDFGTLNPVSAFAEIVSKIDEIQVAEEPPTTFNVGVVAGGVSVNVIPRQVSFEMDLRSENAESLANLEKAFLDAVDLGVSKVNNRAKIGAHTLTYETTVIGDRPCGMTAKNNPLVRSVSDAADQLGLDVAYEIGSSDANVPMNLGIPAVMLGVGGGGGGLHSANEWFDPQDAYLGRQRSLLSILLFDAA